MDEIPDEIRGEIMTHLDHNSQTTMLQASIYWNKRITAQQYFCAECQRYHPMTEMQDYYCSLCNCRNFCRKLHGGHDSFECNFCHKSGLCIHCLSFALCCINKEQ